ncbi:hypothetical protein P3G55_20745 [Leptospira sp. 96542]|nr:hypothetical protein [Leptospira sp. 96542]
MAASNEARIWGVIAASGSGKGVWLKNQLRRLKPARLVIWDHKLEYQEFAPALVQSADALRIAMLKAKGGPLRIRYRCKTGTDEKQMRAEFQAVCRLVQAWRNCMFIAEELSNVTTPSWAPPAWREMSTGGRHEGVHIVGVAQNPALIDKTFLSNCTMVHVGRLNQHSHRMALARTMDVPLAEIAALEKFEWIERDLETRELREGKEKPPTARP